MRSQKELIYLYNRDNRERFNESLFIRKDEDIIEEVKKVILSSQRDRFFKIKVNGFRTIKDYRDIHNILQKEEEKHKNKRIKFNKYDMIDLKDTDVVLLEVSYYLEDSDGVGQNINTYIAIPKIVNKYYFRINGCLYSAMYQLVDGSTYNNYPSASKSDKKNKGVVLKTIFIKLSVFLKQAKIQLEDKTPFPCNYFSSLVFSKNISVMEYFLGKYGFFGTVNFLRLDGLIVSDKPMDNDNYYHFKRYSIFIHVLKNYFDSNNVMQSLVYTVYSNSYKDTVIEDILDRDYWLNNLGEEFKSRTVEKGESVLDSLEHIYDIKTKEELCLPIDQKDTIYHVLRWIIYEFQTLYQRENTDFSTKRIRYAEYVAFLYAIKLSTAIYRLSNGNSKIKLNKLISAINIKNSYLIDALKNCTLNSYKNSVNDNDALSVLKYTQKGIAGIGENKPNAVSVKQRFVNSSQLGKVDLNSSSNSDPGMSGLLCPYITPNEQGYFVQNFKEPCTWEKQLDLIIDNHKKMTGTREFFVALENILGENQTDNINQIDESLNQYENITFPYMCNNNIVEEVVGYPMEMSGHISMETFREENI